MCCDIGYNEKKRCRDKNYLLRTIKTSNTPTEFIYSLFGEGRNPLAQSHYSLQLLDGFN